MRSRMLQVGDIRTPLLEAGPEDAAEAVLFVHGNPGSAGDWSALVEAVGTLGRAIAFDMPGFGGARRPAGFQVHVGSYAQFIERARMELGIERLHLVLHDFGGPFGLAWGLEHPTEWASVTLIDVGVMPGYRWHWLARRWRTPLIGELTMLAVPRAAFRFIMARANPKRLPAEFIDQMYGNFDRETRDTVLKLYRATPAPDIAASAAGEAIAALKKPALVIWGGRDPFLHFSYAERQRDFFDVQDLLMLAGSGHWPYQDDPEPVRRALLSFYAGRLASAQAPESSSV